MGKPFFVHNSDNFTITNMHLVELMDDVFQKNKVFRFRASGNSMWPFIKDGDVITLAPITEKRLRIGDVLALVNQNKKKLFVHRLISTRHDLFQTKGDFSQQADTWVSKDNIIAIVTKVERNEKSLKYPLGHFSPLIAWLSKYQVLDKMIKSATFLLSPLQR